MPESTAPWQAGTAASRPFETVEEVEAVMLPVMHAIAGAVGPSCEVVLHDLSRHDMRHSIVAIVNAHVSGREVGGPSTNMGLAVLQDETTDHNAFGYGGVTADGRELRSSSVYFRDGSGRVIAALCINYDLDPIQRAVGILNGILGTSWQSDDRVGEFIAPDIKTVLDDMIESAIQSTGKSVSAMDRTDRIEVLRQLESSGAFHVKRAVDRVARRMGVSKPTVYSYLDEIRNPGLGK